MFISNYREQFKVWFHDEGMSTWAVKERHRKFDLWCGKMKMLWLSSVSILVNQLKALILYTYSKEGQKNEKIQHFLQRPIRIQQRGDHFPISARHKRIIKDIIDNSIRNKIHKHTYEARFLVEYLVRESSSSSKNIDRQGFKNSDWDKVLGMPA